MNTEEITQSCLIVGEEFTLPKDHILKDENGNVINAKKIVLEKANTLKTQSDNMETETHRGYYTTEEDTTNKSKKLAWFSFFDSNFADKEELDLSNRELIQEDGKWFVVKKKKEYPKTYEECCKIIGFYSDTLKWENPFRINRDTHPYIKNLDNLMEGLCKLFICRDAYWKLYGDEMGLGELWEPDWKNDNAKYSIYTIKGVLTKAISCYDGAILTFPTEEMRDAFYENFKELINQCKELL